MALPLIAIVGRPNVGKSMLFNKIIGRRLSIVEDTPGVTRDRIYGESEWVGRKFRLVDTGGIEPNTDSQILSFMREQAQIAIDNADVIIFVTDIKTGLTASDQTFHLTRHRGRIEAVLLRDTGPHPLRNGISRHALTVEDERKIDRWTDQHRTVLIPFDQPGDDPRAFCNTNTLAELHALEKP